VQASAEHTPQPGQTGSECSNGDQCSGSGICLDDYPYDGFGYCADACSTDDDCPFGFVCEPTSVDKRCTNADCGVSTSADACVSEYLGRAVDACQAGCEGEFATWFACLAGAAPVCFEGDASACSTAKGLLDHCCEDGNLCS
jgi:hypothetical protein